MANMSKAGQRTNSSAGEIKIVHFDGGKSPELHPFSSVDCFSMFQTSAAVNPPTKDDWEQRRSISRRELSKSSYPGNPKDYVTDFKETKCTESKYLGRGMCPWHDVELGLDGTGMTDRNEVRE